MARSTVSIAMCTYNGARFLQEQLDSFTAQTRLPDEVVICDDGSTDKTLEILEAWVRNVPFEVRIFRNEKNLGFAQNFGKAISLCTKNVIFLSDQDDVWEPEKISVMMVPFEDRPEVGVVSSGGFIIDENGKRLNDQEWRLAQNWFYDETTAYCVFQPKLTDCFPRGCASAFRASLRDILLPIPPHWSHDLWLNVIYRCRFQGCFLPTPLFSYRIYTGNTTSGSFESRLKLMDHKKQIFHWNAASQYWANEALISEFEERIGKLEPTPYVQRCIRYLANNRKHFPNRSRVQRNAILFFPLFLLEIVTGHYFQHYAPWHAIFHDLRVGFCNGLNPVTFAKNLYGIGKKIKEKSQTKKS
ncbi:MAG: glycosyltransferase family 2 protein [Thermoguttaceae bacterium]|nr:glycosyltransferase family 2 protein [Thermoguttaceae bacterium]